MPTRRTDLENRFWSKVEPTGFCWNWTKGLNKAGYGQFSLGTTGSAMAHRFAYELLVGPIPDKLVLDHLCRNTRCVNPDHLEPVTQRENIARGKSRTASNMVKTHCHRGHPLSGTNLRINSASARQCKQCHADRQRGYRKIEKHANGGK